LLNIINVLQKGIVFFISWVNLELAQQLPTLDSAMAPDALSFYKATSEADDPFDFGFQKRIMVEVFGLIEPFKLVVDIFCLCYV
jgi:hypothetical protein